MYSRKHLCCHNVIFSKILDQSKFCVFKGLNRKCLKCNRCQRMTNKDLHTGMQSFLSASRSQGDYAAENDTGPHVSSRNNVDVSFAEALHSWTHPQSVLPSSVLSTLASSAAHGGTAGNFGLIWKFLCSFHELLRFSTSAQLQAF